LDLKAQLVVAVGIFLLLWFLTWRQAVQVIRAAKGISPR
jgi:hypothetical protein